MFQHLTSIHSPKHHKPNGKKVSTQSRHVTMTAAGIHQDFRGKLFRQKFEEKNQLPNRGTPKWMVYNGKPY